MASIKPHNSGWRAQVAIKGRRTSKIFRTKREADAWANAQELAITQALTRPPSERITLAECMRKYGEEESPKKEGRRWEAIRISAMIRDDDLNTDALLSDINPKLFGDWRNKRLKKVSAGTVIKEFGLLSVILEWARKEKKWISENPMRDVKRPKSPEHRTTTITPLQIRAMLKAMGWKWKPCRSVSQACACAFLLSLRTGMRAGELCGLTWSRVFENYCKTSGKTPAARRDVPFTSKAKRLIDLMRGWDDELVFGIKTATLDALFRKYRKKAGLDGFTFHDSRHTAATWLARKLHILDLCLMFGWANTSHALIYYNASAESIAKQLEPVRPPTRDRSL